VIVSKDADFFQRAVLYGPPPKVVWLGIGNGPTRIAEAVLRRYVDAVEAFGVDERSAWLRLPA
jgi:predicted nuclease of predicted toxin-antitoxin system